MLKGLQGGFTTVAVTVVTLSLVFLELADRGFRGWLAARPFTADIMTTWRLYSDLGQIIFRP